MDLEQTLLQTAIIFLGGLLAIAVSWIVLKPQLFTLLRGVKQPERFSTETVLLPLRLQAHERMIVFIDRIDPLQLVVRMPEPGMSVAQLQQRLTAEIASEFQHNITQQLYIKSTTWQAIQRLKDDTILMINKAGDGLEPGATPIMLSARIVAQVAALEQHPYTLAINLLKADVHKLYNV